MSLQDTLAHQVKNAVNALFKATLESVEFQATRKEFAGDITVVIFPMLRVVKGNPQTIGEQIGQFLVENVEEVKAFNLVKGFLNIEISDAYYIQFFNEISSDQFYGFVATKTDEKAVMVEYSSPNTNKPLHLGHVRNNLLGYSVAEIIKASGKKVYKTQIINDRGIHICKSMLAWKRFGNGETPESTGLKGDKLVGKYYVEFDKAYKKEIESLIAQGKTEDDAKKQAPILLEAQEMLQKWEAGHLETVALWMMMNQWVYEGFELTYNDGSVWCDLTPDGLDEKIVLRSDGTAVYMTQDIGTAIQRIKDYPDVGGLVYTVGNEQDYHFKVLFLILKKLGFDWAKNLFHLSYGMVDLPSGKMKSREGTVVDADDLITEMAQTAGEISEELGKLEGYSEEEKQELYKTIGLGALKYFILKVDPKKRILFDPKESIDFQGNTGPFIQYTYARIQSILRKYDANSPVIISAVDMPSLHEKEKELIKQIQLFPEVIQNAAANYSPALIANYTYDLVKEFNSFYQNVSILGADIEAEKDFRVQLSRTVANIIKNAFSLLGIQVPERM